MNESDMVRELLDLYVEGGLVERLLTDWEMTFLESLSERLEEGRDLAEEQSDKLRQIYEEVLG